MRLGSRFSGTSLTAGPLLSTYKTIKEDIQSGILRLIGCDWPAIHSEAERLSAKYTAGTGHRSMDILHVATALTTGARDFLSFDRNQSRLARADGLAVALERGLLVHCPGTLEQFRKAETGSRASACESGLCVSFYSACENCDLNREP